MLFECVENLENAGTIAGSEVDGFHAGVGQAVVNCFEVTQCEVYNMDVVADAGSVYGVVVIAEYAQTWQLADCNLCDVWQEVVWNAVWIFADETAFMSTDWVEVTQQDDAPFLVSNIQVGKDLLDHNFGVAVRIGCGGWHAFFERNWIVHAVYGCGGGENDLLAAVFTHALAEHQGAGDVVVVVFQWLLNRFTNCLESCKVDNGFDVLFFKDFIDCRFVQKVCLIKDWTNSGDFSMRFKTSGLELEKLSTITTSFPAWISSTTVWLPINPAPPVTRIAMVTRSFLFDINVTILLLTVYPQ